MITLFSTIETELADSIWDSEILGTNEQDLLIGGEEDDLLRGTKGDDALDGGDGHDLLKGGKGNDLLIAGDGHDLLKGGKGNDLLIGGDGHDLLKGGKDDDILDGGDGHDLLKGGKGNDLLIGGDGNDLLKGGKDDDTLEGGMGSDTLRGGKGNDLLISRSDAGEPEIGQETDATKVYPDQIITETDDTLIGGKGADTFRFEILLNAKVEIMEKHADDTGTINWRGVAGENDNVHDHWVEGIGNDVIRGFDRDAGDKIEIRGHTVTVDGIESAIDNEGKRYSIISLFSNQGGAGAHDGDQLGTISVYGDSITESDLQVEGMTFDAVYQNISEFV